MQDYLLSSATLLLVYSPEPDTYRVILQADTQAVGVCMPLSSRQLEGLITGKASETRQFSIYFLVKEMDGVEVVGSSMRFDELVPSKTGAELYPSLLEGE